LMRKNQECVAFAHVENVSFPETSGHSVNMMPFLLDDFSTLPEDLCEAYGPMIKTCRNSLPPKRENEVRVAYLTVQESDVSKGESQRRPGLHTEGFAYLPCEKSGHEILSHPYWHHWGFGKVLRQGKFSGGIFMASDVDDSTHVYNTIVPDNLVGAGGDLEHLRPVFNECMPDPPLPRTNSGKNNGHVPYAACGAAHERRARVTFDAPMRVRGPISIQANQLFWMTDHTPHESMPLKEGQRRKFFRLVTGRVDAWFAAHSTPNPLGTMPDARIITQDKFTGREVVRDVPQEGVADRGLSSLTIA